jgi:predicted GNAT family N-acyltransferase
MSDKKEYVSYELNTDIDFDEDGNEIESEEYVLISRVYVPEEKRGQGVARKIMTEALAEIAKEHPSKTIKIAAYPLEETTDLDRLVDFYESLGFEVSDSTGNCHAVIMEM